MFIKVNIFYIIKFYFYANVKNFVYNVLFITISDY